MRRVSNRLAVLSLLVVIAAHGAFASPRDDDPRRAERTLGSQIVRLIVTVLDQLGVPKP